MRMVPDTPLSQAHQVFLQLGCQHIFIVGSHSVGSADALLGIISKKNFLRFLKDGRVGHMPHNFEVPTNDGASESGGDGGLRISYASKARRESTLTRIRPGELFSVLDTAAKAASNKDLDPVPEASGDAEAQNGTPSRGAASAFTSDEESRRTTPRIP